MEKFCVFCGNKPERKSKEHIIPKWLLEMTGDPSRTINLAVDWERIDVKAEKKHLPLIEYSFGAFQFPACQECNSKHGSLEGEAKIIVTKLLKGKPIGRHQISRFLDWLDKIRIGLWLAFFYLHKNQWHIQPQFHITKRMGTKDRMVAVYQVLDDQEGIQFSGATTPAFQFAPSCFTLVINNLYFFNISTEFLFARRLGFPYPREMYYHTDLKNLVCDVVPGTERVMFPLIRKGMVKTPLEIYQPMFFPEWRLNEDSPYDSEYVKENCSSWDLGIGKVFLQEAPRAYPLSEDSRIEFGLAKKYHRDHFEKIIMRQTLAFQLHTLDVMPSTGRLSSDQKKAINPLIDLAKRFNQRFMGEDWGRC